MRVSTVALLIAVGLPLAACGPKAEKKAEAPKVVETPTRKPGLWKQTMSAEGMPNLPAVSFCINGAVDKKLAWWGQQGARGGCRKNDVTQNADGSWSFESICEAATGARTVTSGKASGDFQSSYRVEATTTTVGAPTAELNGAKTVVMTATWDGPCPSDMQPGDMRLPDGSLVNLVQLTGG